LSDRHHLGDLPLEYNGIFTNGKSTLKRCPSDENQMGGVLELFVNAPHPSLSAKKHLIQQNHLPKHPTSNILLDTKKKKV